ncbi:MAG: transketolase [Pseudodesulfovibrio sp.]|uniref:Transketolase n=1 Tax=Pseudodesulfovibrio aespoeensis (strain ATCC 700646 / DSM 10631 / Aspo-2) TaxID=643562 RepID=E6VR46_PSEA9|nr:MULTISPECIES: transketolase [Pseudodesulfovibrio]MBU4192170.1 transketolase [Pseudomonadota bacterium]ADU64130.1 transketolase [Pseudodesulfovibrio aespoeensis Aspo-2]MBU4245145.1 transketolase [Pseudomonadota bacterium]MBU4379056.1 transketolase [Pseudomonadota bacterium]MBU4474478.1 transketolase [Pseudomonadota bacterium]
MTNMTDKTVAVVKGLIMDGVAKANSGHPGGAMSSADYATILFSEFLDFNPDDASWFNRDRFILSAGHESMLLYSLLHLNGFISMDDIKNFRQLGSLTPGHPEVHLTPGVEATTGPLGQGFAMSVGFAAAEAHLRARLGEDALSHYTYVLSSDGDLQEPIALGAASLAGLWKLGKLIAYYDSNKIQLAGPTCKADCTDHKKVFEGLCWQVIEVDGHNHDEIRAAIRAGQMETGKPTLIIGHTVMAKGCATMEGSHKTHGEPLKADEIAATKKKLGLPATDFHVPADVLAAYCARFDGLRAKAAAWQTRVDAKLAKDAPFAALWAHVTTPRPELAIDWPSFTPGESVATRQAWGKCLDAVTNALPTLVGGSADLDPSNQTMNFRTLCGDFAVDGYAARNLAFGVREFPMAAIMNGMQLHGGLLPFGATFLTFSDYCRNAIRMSALQDLPVLYVFTHDSFWVGEDGPTHQPIEHVSSLRLIPDLIDLRPADANETATCLDIALKQPRHPSCLFLTRQGLPVLDPAEYPAIIDGPRRGAYVLKECDGTPDLILIASGSEVSLALATARLFKRKVRVVSMPSAKLFDDQPESYKHAVLPPAVTARAAAEAGRTGLWYKYVGLDGVVLGLDHFGASAPGKVLSDRYGFTPENFARMIREKY